MIAHKPTSIEHGGIERISVKMESKIQIDAMPLFSLVGTVCSGIE
jgi:hypothetical protein